MSKYTAFVIIIALRLVYHPSPSASIIAPFAAAHNQTTAPFSLLSATITSFQGTLSENNVRLRWAVSENETADQFEIEKSVDGKHFTMTALVFGTDKPATASYQFYEKVGNQKVLYRIKLINKNKQAEYSGVVEINPKA